MCKWDICLQVCLRLSGVSPGDEVIIPSPTFIAPVNAISYMGAFPIFMDSDDYYNIDAEKTIDFIKTNTIIKNGFSYNKITNRKISNNPGTCVEMLVIWMI